jgi:hypothetical protein
MEASLSSETSANIYKTMSFPEESNLEEENKYKIFRLEAGKQFHF